MNRQITIQQYRAIDLSLFALMLAVSEAVIVTAATKWFPDQLYTVSVTASLVSIVMMRWNGFAAFHAILGGAVPSPRHLRCVRVSERTVPQTPPLRSRVGENRSHDTSASFACRRELFS